jgi:hypothetical protein
VEGWCGSLEGVGVRQDGLIEGVCDCIPSFICVNMYV